MTKSPQQNIEHELVLLNKEEIDKKDEEKQIPHDRWYTIDTYMLPAKFCHFLCVANLGIFKPYAVLFLINTGLTPTEAGLVNGVCYLGTLFGAPAWGYFADHFQKHKFSMFLILLFTILTMSSLPLLSYKLGDEKINQCPLNLNESMYKEYQLEKEDKSFSSNLFWIFLFYNIFIYLFEGSIIGFLNAATIQRIHQSARDAQFGRQRLYGAVGYGVGALLGSFLVDIFPNMALNCYSGVFIGYLVNSILLMASSMWLFHGLKIQKDETTTNFNLLKTTLSKFHVQFFLITIVICGLLQAIYVFFNSVILKDLNAPTMLNGIAMATGAFPCVLIFLFAKQLINFLGGTLRSLLLCCFSYVVRFVVVAYLKNPWFILFVQPLQAFGLGLFIASYVEHVRKISDPSILTTMCSITNVCIYSVAYITANIAGGKIYDEYGGRILFMSAAVLAFIWSLVLLVFIIFHERNENEKKDSQEIGLNSLAKVS